MKAPRYDLLAALFAYPDDGYRDAFDRCLAALARGKGEAADLLRPLSDHLGTLSVSEAQELYTRTFDINPVCTLEVSWHIYGEDYARGELLVKMRELLRTFNLPESTELPDHLTHVLALLGRLEQEQADDLAARYVLPALEKMLAGMDGKEQPYRALIAATRALVQEDHAVEPMAPPRRRGDPPGWNRRVPMLGGQGADGPPALPRHPAGGPRHG